jgi:uracil phosphoribosyltransferase
LKRAKKIGLNHLPVVPKTVKTPVGMEYEGVSFQGRICGVSIMRGKLLMSVNSDVKLTEQLERYVGLADSRGELTVGYGSWFEGLLSIW